MTQPYQEWLTAALGSRTYRGIEPLKADIKDISKVKYGPGQNHVNSLAAVVSASVKSKVEEIGVSTLSHVLDTDHKKAIAYGMLNQESSTFNHLVRHPASGIINTYFQAFIRRYHAYASAGEQSLIRNGSFDMESLAPDRLVIRRMPKLDPRIRLAYARKINKAMTVISVDITDSTVVFGFKPGLTFEDFYGIGNATLSSVLFTDAESRLTPPAKGLFAFTIPFAEDLFRLTHVLKTIRRVQYEHNH